MKCAALPDSVTDPDGDVEIAHWRAPISQGSVTDPDGYVQVPHY
jgi:hypothetical protein